MMRGGIQPSEKLPKSRLISFQEGMQELPKRLAEKLQTPPVLGCEIKKIEIKNNGKWSVQGVTQDGKIKEALFDEVISTLPSHVLLKIEWVGINAAHLLKTLTQTFSTLPLPSAFKGSRGNKSSIPWMALVSWCLRKKKGRFLVLFFSTFSKSSSRKLCLLTTFVGGERNPELCTLPESEIMELAYKENQKLGNRWKTDLLNILNYGQNRFPFLIPQWTRE